MQFKQIFLFVLVITCVTGVVRGDKGFPSLPGQDPWENRPNDPKYREQWQLYSHLPVDHRGEVSPWEQEHGSGMATDKAWQLHVGDPQTVVAILDSGIRWQERDLLERHWLNVGELPLPEGCTTYDCNGDGRVSVGDYANDSRVNDANGNGVLDPGDLIAVFSNGRDDDGNGYVDDIAGWDFHEHDNDPFDRTDFGHGTGEAKDSVAAINNGIGGAGICGNCSVIFLRLNDSFIVDAQAFAQAVMYATNIGANLIQQALGSVNASHGVKEAINYAYEHGVTIIGSAADENSYHHNFPSTFEPIIYANSIRYDSQTPQEANTFINFNNCSNYGARVDVSVPGRSCSSEATGNLSGVAALAYSYSKSLGKPLTAVELTSLIKTTADDINRGPNTDEPTRHATHAGWDTISGYGRVNAWRMLEAIKERRIPPGGRIMSPEWFTVVRADQETLPVAVAIPLPRSGGVKATLSVARGVETTETEFLPLTELESRKAIHGVMYELSLAQLLELPISPLDEPRNDNAFTLRLVLDNLNGETSEERRTFFIVNDPDLFASFPRQMAGSGESAGVFYDLNGDGREEFITADGSGAVHAYTYPNGELPGFPFLGVRSSYASTQLELKASVFAPLAVGDLDGDGTAEIVVATLEGDVIVLNNRGQMQHGFPQKLPFPDMRLANKKEPIAQGVLAAPVLADLNGDQKLEILIAALDSHLYAFDSHGRLLTGYPLPVTANNKRARLVSSPAVVDLNGDGYKDIILGSNHVDENAGYLFAFDGRGTRIKQPKLAGFPRKIPLMRDKVLPTVGTGVPTSPVVADFDQDGQLDILIHAFVGKAYLLSADGQIKQSLSTRVARGHETNDKFMLTAFGHPSLARVLSGQLIPIAVGAGQKMLMNLALGGKRIPFDHMVGAWNPMTGEMLPSFPRKHDDMILTTSVIAADLTGDGQDELLSGSGGYWLRGMSLSQGNLVRFPKFTGGWMLASPTLGDFDGDGKWDIAVTTREGYVFIWRTGAQRGSATWPTFKGNPQRTGTFGG